MFTPVEKPAIAVLGLGLELYDRAIPSLTARLQHQLDCFVKPLTGEAEVVLSRLCSGENQVAATVRDAEDKPLDALLVIPMCYTASLASLAPFNRFDIPHWVIQLDEPVGEVLTRYSLAGGPHHLVALPGRHAEALRKLSVLQGFLYKRL